MSDPNTEEDSLISQGDIDKLLESSSIEEAEDKLASNSESIDSEDVEDLGELSQDDIDTLMNVNSSDLEEQNNDDAGELSQDDIDKMMNTSMADPDEDLDDDNDDDMELISQDDIDSLMNSSESNEQEDDSEETDAQEDDAGELSQDDIDRMMNANASDSRNEEEDEAGELSQEDIDKMMGTVSEGELSPPDDDEELEMISQDDISSLIDQETDDAKESSADRKIGNAPSDNLPDLEKSDPDIEDKPGEDAREDVIVEEKSEDPEPVKTPVMDNYTIEESEAVDVTECLVTQDTIDDLIKNAGSEPESEPEPVPEVEPEPEQVILDEEPVTDSDETTASEDELPDDLDEDLFDMDGEGEDVGQEEIDALLLDSDDDEDYEDDDLLISQDDIDTLLMAGDQEDEDVLGDLMDEAPDDLMDEEIDDEAIVEDDEDQVVLEDDDSEEVADDEPENAEKTKWYKSKLVIACASGLIAMGIIVPAVYFFFFSGNSEQPMDRVQQHAVEGSREIAIETVDIDLKSQGVLKQSGNVVLENFVILASDQSKDMAYIAVDISIDYSDQRAYHEIQNNLSFYRDLIYDSINKSLASGKQDEVTEADLLWKVETSLKKVLPGTYINRVSFKSFKAS